MVEEGGFRKDLFYRLNIFPIRLPALRDRKGDIPLLIESVMKRFSDHPVLIDEDARSLLLGHSYPGNIRELRNILERALILSDGETITPDHLPDLQESLPEISSWEESKQLLSLREAEGRYLDWVLSRSEEPLSDLALKLGVSPRTLYRKMDKKRKRGSHRV
jgi:transcriptional regulator with PAS, ATPase and Fis domain